MLFINTSEETKTERRLGTSQALISNSELTSLNDIALIPREFKRLTWSLIRLISGETTSTIYDSYELACEQSPSEVGKKNSASEASGSHSFRSRFKPEISRKCCKELLKAASNSSSVNCALHAQPFVDDLGKNYANLQAVVKICQLFISELSTVIDSINQILIPAVSWNGGISGMSTGARLPCALPPHQTALGSSRSL